jgi:hypothetical protein
MSIVPRRFQALPAAEKAAFVKDLDLFCASIAPRLQDYGMTAADAEAVLTLWGQRKYTLSDVACLCSDTYEAPLSRVVYGPMIVMLSALFYSSKYPLLSPQLQVPPVHDTMALWSLLVRGPTPTKCEAMGRGFAYMYRALMHVARNDKQGLAMEREMQKKHWKPLCEILLMYFEAGAVDVDTDEPATDTPNDFFVGFFDELLKMEMAYSREFRNNNDAPKLKCNVSLIMKLFDEALDLDAAEPDLTQVQWPETYSSSALENASYFKGYPNRLPAAVKQQPHIVAAIDRMEDSDVEFEPSDDEDDASDCDSTGSPGGLESKEEDEEEALLEAFADQVVAGDSERTSSLCSPLPAAAGEPRSEAPVTCGGGGSAAPAQERLYPRKRSAPSDCPDVLKRQKTQGPQ